jgi:diguanylate cyclase (GGDEF)-like protein/PAS domain S-box-containing protein
MPEYTLEFCAELTRLARTLEGEPLAQTLATLQAALEHLRVTAPAEVNRDVLKPVINMDMLGYVTGWNEGARQLFGYTAEEAIGQHVLFLYAEDDSEVAELFLEPSSALMEVRRRKKSGEVFWVGLLLTVDKDDSDSPVGMSAHFSEITERLSAEDKLRLHARIIEDSDQGILITDAHERIVSVNAAFSRITGYTPAEAIGETPDLLRSGLHDANFREQVRAAMYGAAPWHGEIQGKRKSGEVFPQTVSISVVRNDAGKITHAFSIFSDISVHKEAQERLTRLTNYDGLTGLPNRALLNELLGQALTAARRNGDHGAVLVVSLDRISAIRDTLGQEFSDELVSQVGARLRGALRDEDVLARVGNDKFTAALFSIQRREHAAIVAKKLLDTLVEPISIEANDFRLTASIGISIYPEDGLETASLIRFAEVAMTRVQQDSEIGYLFYSPEMNQRAQEHLRLESELRRAMTGGQLQLHYQPKVSLRSGRIVGAEALLRWRHPEQGMISPARFIPVAEETGLILELGNWVLDEACRQIRAWQDAGLNTPPIAVNISSRQFDRHLPERLQAVLDLHGVSPEYLKLEITESLLVRGADNVIPIMNELVAMGLALALDDFGTGYSSLAYLKKFPISTLKIDRSFVIGLPNEENDCAIARAIVTMAQQLRQEIVAEGVETHEQMAFLRDLGCDQLQGYLFSPAVQAADFERIVREVKRLALT